VLAQCQGMMTFTELASVPSDPLAPFTDQLRLAVAAYLTSFEGSSRGHTGSDLRCYLAWCAGHGLDPPRRTDGPARGHPPPAAQIAARHADPGTTMRYGGPPQPRPPPELHPGRLHGLRHLTQRTSPAARAAGDVRH
jgi:hypothetical protein